MTTHMIDIADNPPLSHGDAMALLEVELQGRSISSVPWTTRTGRHRPRAPTGTCVTCTCTYWEPAKLPRRLRENVHQMRLARRHRSRHGGPSGGRPVERPGPGKGRRVPPSSSSGLSGGAGDRPEAHDDARSHAWHEDEDRRTGDREVDPRLPHRHLYLRDHSMNRVNATDATGSELELTANHDGLIVGDVVGEWARRHGRPFSLTLDGPARRESPHPGPVRATNPRKPSSSTPSSSVERSPVELTPGSVRRHRPVLIETRQPSDRRTPPT